MLTTLILTLLTFNSPAITITGHCYNISDNSVITSNVTAVFKSSKLRLKTSGTGNFKFQIPDSTLALIFEAEGFETRNIPINFVQKPKENAAFEISVSMIKNGFDQAIKMDETLFPRNVLFLHYDVPDSLIASVLLSDESKRSVSETRPILNKSRLQNQSINYMGSGPYSLAKGVYFPNQNMVTVVSREKVTLAEGFNFLSIRFENLAVTGENAVNAKLTLLTPRTLYFDQSSYQLRKDSRLTLDSICMELVRRHNLIAKVTGHTDNVGRRNLNLILSEYRSRVVQNYMKVNGVKPGQIQLAWKGPDEPVAANDSEENRIKNRRVEMRFVDAH